MIARGLDYTAKRCQLKYHQLPNTFIQGQGSHGEPDRTLKFSSKMEFLLDDRVQPHQVQWLGVGMEDAKGGVRRDELTKQLDSALALRREFVDKIYHLDGQIANLMKQLKDNAQETLDPVSVLETLPCDLLFFPSEFTIQ